MRVPPSLDEQIYKSDVIVRASLLSATSGTETVPSADKGVAPTYRPVQKLRLNVHEFLKGIRPSEVVVVVSGRRTYLTEAEARREADYSVSRRNTAWDGRQGALFLGSGPTEPKSAGGGTGVVGGT